MDNLKILPHDIQAEQAVLGSLFIDPDKITAVAEYVKAEDFYKPAHKTLFKVMLDLTSRGNGQI